jgi:hypothetical protein
VFRKKSAIRSAPHTKSDDISATLVITLYSFASLYFGIYPFCPKNQLAANRANAGLANE